MGIFDTIREIGDNIGASIGLAFATPASDETMAQVYDYLGRDREDQDTLYILKFVLGYGTDAHIAMNHIDNIIAMKRGAMPITEIAKCEGISVEMVERIFQMMKEYSVYKNTGELPLNTNHTPIGGDLNVVESRDRYDKYYQDLTASDPRFAHLYSNQDKQNPNEQQGKTKPFTTSINGKAETVPNPFGTMLKEAGL